MSEPLLQLVCAALVLLIPVGIHLALPRSPRHRIVAVVAVGVLAAVVSIGVDVVTTSRADASALVLDASMAGGLASVMTLLAAQRLNTLGGATFALAWSVLVYQPVAAAVLDGVPSFTQVVLGAVDYGGVLASHVAAAAALLVLAVLPARGVSDLVTDTRASWPRAVLGAGLLVIGASAWLLAVERVLTEASGRTLANALTGMTLGALVWVLVEKIAIDRLTPSGLVGGVVVGWATLGAGAPYLSPIALGATVIIGTAAAVGAAARVLGRGTKPMLAGSIAILVGAFVGAVVTSLLADRFGLSETGTLTLSIGQIVAVIVVGLAGAAGGVLCWLLAGAMTAIGGKKPTAPSGSDTAAEG
jgi:ammonia channel protein AmtB